MSYMEKLQQEINEKQKELEKLKKEFQDLKSLGPEYMLAFSLHAKLCHYNHTDGCGWYYEIHDGVHDWTGGSHLSYLEKARKLLKTGVDPETILLVIDNLEEV